MKARTACVVWLFLALPLTAQYEKWKNTEGKVIEAELTKVEGENVILILRNGKQVSYPIAKLAEESRKMIEEFKAMAEFAENAPAGVSKDPKLISRDETYGFTKENPVKVGTSRKNSERLVEEEYLDKLRDADGEKVRYQKLGGSGKAPDGHELQLYEIITADGLALKLYIDSTHPECKPDKQPAPKDFWKAK